VVTAAPYAWMAKRRERYGDVFSSHFPFFGRVVYVADPALVKEVFTGDPQTFHAGEANATVLGDALGDNSLLTLDEGRHMSQRKLLLPPFHGGAVRRYAEVMAEATEREVAGWPVGRAFALRPHMQAITLEVILRAVFGVRDGARMDLFRERIPRLSNLSSVLDWLPVMQRDLGGLTPAARFRKAVAAVDELIYAEIAERRAIGDAADRDDVLTLLLSAHHEDGSPMSDVELRDELMTLLTAGFETTATGLSWAFERLLRTPAVMERTLESLDDDDYLDAVVKETLRIRPVVPFVVRQVAEPVELAGRRWPPGVRLAPCVHLVHRRPDVYPEPDAFRPERFLETPPGTYTWIPFGGGTRRCLGAAFASFEIKVVLRTILRRAMLRPATDRPEPYGHRNVTLSPRNGTPAILEERRPAREPETREPERAPMSG
jgi:cytochrome P450 family 135